MYCTQCYSYGVGTGTLLLYMIHRCGYVRMCVCILIHLVPVSEACLDCWPTASQPTRAAGSEIHSVSTEKRRAFMYTLADVS